MICVAVTYVIKEGHAEQAVTLLSRMSELTRTEEGNLMYIAHRSPTDPHRFFLYEQYTDQEALDFHRASPHFQEHVVNGLLHIIETRTPEIYVPIGD
jgi:quinol monooxygenase YgiN